MATNIQFTDGTGAATLSNGRNVPGDRFWAWAPLTRFVGPSNVTIGDGVTRVFPFRTDYGARFEIRNLPDTEVDVALRLIRHLLQGNTCTVNTGDTSARTYTARLWPGEEPSLDPADDRRRHYTLRLALKNGAAADMLCEY